MKNKKIIIITIVAVIIGSLTTIGVLLIPKYVKNSYLIQAETFYNNCNPVETFRTLEEGIMKYPENKDLYYQYIKTVNVYSLLKFYRFEELFSKTIISTIIEKYHNSKDAKLLTEIGIYFWNFDNNYELAKVFFEEAVSIDSKYYPPYNYLGNYYYYADYTKGKEYYKKLFKLNPEFLDLTGIKINNFFTEEILKSENLKALFITTINKELYNGLKNLKKLEILSLTELNIPSEALIFLNGLNKLKVLSLSSNSITKLVNFENLSDLKILILNNNKINKIENLDKLTNIQRLVLNNNQIDKIENLEKLSNLQVLDLRYNNISKIENLEKLSNLQSLYLRGNKVSRIENLDQLKNLISLDLQDNQIKKLENLDQLNSLLNLFLSHNQIQKLENLNKLNNLLSLDLFGNQISKIENLDSLIYINKIDLFGNKISKIENLNKLKYLLYLYLGNNQISKLENLEGVSGLKTLNLINNKISKLEGLDNLNNLQVFYINNNKISKIENLDRLINLHELYLNGNKISKIENLNLLSDLQIIYLNDNQIGTLENLSNLKKLKALVIENNKISKIENLEGLTGLQILNLMGNQINNIENIDKLTELQELDLCVNQINSQGKAIIEFTNPLNNLRNLIIAGPSNTKPSNTKYIKGLENCINLEKLGLSYLNLLELPDMKYLTKLIILQIEKSVPAKQIDFTKIPANIKSLSLISNNLKNLDGIEHLSEIEDLSINDNPGLTSLSNLNDIKTLKRLSIVKCFNLPSEEILKLDNIMELLISANSYPESVLKKLSEKGILIQINQ